MIHGASGGLGRVYRVLSTMPNSTIVCDHAHGKIRRCTKGLQTTNVSTRCFRTNLSPILGARQRTS